MCSFSSVFLLYLTAKDSHMKNKSSFLWGPSVPITHLQWETPIHKCISISNEQSNKSYYHQGCLIGDQSHKDRAPPGATSLWLPCITTMLLILRQVRRTCQRHFPRPGALKQAEVLSVKRSFQKLPHPQPGAEHKGLGPLSPEQLVSRAEDLDMGF